jgi:hypothetical protein
MHHADALMKGHDSIELQMSRFHADSGIKENIFEIVDNIDSLIAIISIHLQ